MVSCSVLRTHYACDFNFAKGGWKCAIIANCRRGTLSFEIEKHIKHNFSTRWSLFDVCPNLTDLYCFNLAAMGWSDQVHATRIQSASKKNLSSQHQISTPQPRKPNAGLLPIALVAGAAASTIWWRKGGHKNFQGVDPLREITAFIKRLFAGPGRKLTQAKSGNWKGNKPTNMAGAAAAQRAQVSFLR